MSENLNIARVFSVNSKVDLWRKEEEEPRRNFIQFLDSKVFGVHYPQEVAWRPGDILHGCVYGEDGRYLFITRVSQRRHEGSIPLLILELPPELERVQERRYVRLDIVMEVQYRLADAGQNDDNEVRVYKGLTRDVSGGGMGMLVEIDDPLPLDTELVMEFKINRQESRVITAIGKIQRCTQAPTGKFLAGVAFGQISEKDRETLIAFIFQQILERRRRER